MKKAAAIMAPVSEQTVEKQTHPLMKSHMLVSTKHVDYNDLSAFEAVSLSAVLILAVLVGTIQAALIV